MQLVKQIYIELHTDFVITSHLFSLCLKALHSIYTKHE
jgi:hypothetical protein